MIGIDLNTEPMRRKALERARDGDRMATAPGIVLRHNDAGNWNWRGFFVALPIFKQGLPHDSVEDRRRNILGILGGTFDTAAVINAILATATLPQNVDLYIYPADAGAGPDAALVYTRMSPEHSEPVEAKSQAQLAEMTQWSAPLKAGDAQWNLIVTPMKGGLISFYRAWLVLASVILVFAAVLAYMWASLRHALRLETANSRILELAQTDLLTNLANRRAFIKRLSMAFTASWRGAPPFAVLYLDIDNFKDVNDTLGHAMGDLLLKEVVNRLRNAVRPGDLVARFGGDEFAILLSQVTDPATAGDLAARIGKLLAAPFSIKGHKVRITSSVGIALYSPDLAGPEAMMVQADLALYGAKDEGRNCYRFHSQDLDLEVHERVRVADELRVAVEQGELELYYQPQVELSTGRIIGLEALIRWNHKTRGLLTPASFIPIAERTGAILPLGHWVFEQACRQLKLWHEEGIAPQVLSVNVSGVQFKGASELDREIEASL
ncbi:MAG: diguanylate cyclase, partial [Methyloceanibacter sp.]